MGAGIVAYFYAKSMAALIIIFISGVFIDLDHIFDYVSNHRFKDLRSFFRKLYNVEIKKVYLLLHSFEIMIILWVYIIVFSPHEYWTYLAIGFSTHIVLDRLSNPLNPGGYFLLYRVFHGFDREKLIRKSFLERVKNGNNR